MKPTKLQNFVENVSIIYFHKPFKHRAYFNTRLRTTGGRYHAGTHHLDFNPKILDAFGEETFLGIVKHELCHYHLHLENKGFQHKDADFKQLLKEVGGLRFTPSLKAEAKSLKVWEYQCIGCHESIYRQRRFNLNKFVCRKCRSPFQLLGRRELVKEDK